MLNKTKNTIILQLNKYPVLKKRMVMFINFLFDFRKYIVGNLTRNPAYLKHLFNSKVLARPKKKSFGAIYNPGSLFVGNEILLLATAQKVPWFKARGKNRKFYLEGSPLLFFLDKKTLEIKDQWVVNDIIGFSSSKDWAIEDMRLFYWRGKKMVNHSLITKCKIDNQINQSSVASAVSILNENDKNFTFYAIPKVDFAVQNIEKNWVYTESEHNLILFYSLNPYRILILEDEKQFGFRSIINKDFSWNLKNPGGFDTMVSFSTNPIDFDDRHWLCIIHQIDHKISGRCYFHWAILIDKNNFLPVKISSKPIFSGIGARGRTPGIRYISSILLEGKDILFFAGEGDIYVTVTKKSLEQIKKDFIDVQYN